MVNCLLCTDQRVLFCQTIFSTLDHVMQWVRNKDMVIGDQKKEGKHINTLYVGFHFSISMYSNPLMHAGGASALAEQLSRVKSFMQSLPKVSDMV